MIRHRLHVFAKETQPLTEYYRSRGILLSVDGNQSVEAVTDAIVGELAKMADTAPER